MRVRCNARRRTRFCSKDTWFKTKRKFCLEVSRRLQKRSNSKLKFLRVKSRFIILWLMTTSCRKEVFIGSHSLLQGCRGKTLNHLNATKIKCWQSKRLRDYKCQLKCTSLILSLLRNSFAHLMTGIKKKRKQRKQGVMLTLKFVALKILGP